MDKTTVLTNVLNNLDQPANLLRRFFKRVKLNGFITTRSDSIVMSNEHLEAEADKQIGVGFENRVMSWTLDGASHQFNLEKQFTPDAIYEAIKSVDDFEDSVEFIMLAGELGFSSISEQESWFNHFQPKNQHLLVQNGEIADLKIKDIEVSLVTDGLFPKHMQNLRNKIFIFPADTPLGTFTREGSYSVSDHGETHSCLNAQFGIYVNMNQPVLVLTLPLSAEAGKDDDFALVDFDSLEIPDVLIEIQTQDEDMEDCEGGACKI
jgi:hypothetical protein